MDEQYVKAVLGFKALADENRIKILNFLLDGERCANDILSNLEVSQSTLSHHLKLLLTAGIITARKEKTWTYYNLNADTLVSLGQSIEKFLPESGQQSKTEYTKPYTSRPDGWLL